MSTRRLLDPAQKIQQLEQRIRDLEARQGRVGTVIVAGRGSAAAASTMSTTEQTKLTFNIDIPSWWSTGWTVDAVCSLRFFDNGTATGIAAVTGRLKVGGAQMGRSIDKIDSSTPDDAIGMAIVGVATGLTSTGTVTISVTTQLGAQNGAYDVGDISSFAYARKEP